MMDFLFIFFNLVVFILGICVGSFLNCVIYRLEHKKTLKGRSFCPNCKHQLSWKDLFPVFSFMFLKGKCRYCKEKISWQYPLVEISSALIFLLIFNFSAQGARLPDGQGLAFAWNFFQFLDLVFLFYAASILIVIFIYDLKHYLIPDKILFPAILISVIYRLFENLVISNWALNSNFKFQILNLLLAVLVGFGFFLTIFLVSKGRWMGFGDVKLAVLMGLLLGFPNILLALFLAFFSGAIIGIILMLFKQKGLKSEIPFGPFLIFGTLIALFWGEQIINWYLFVFTL